MYVKFKDTSWKKSAKYEFATLITYVLSHVSRHDRYSMKKAARGTSFHTKHSSNTNVVREVLLDANSYLALRCLGMYANYEYTVVNCFTYFST
jgi:hypothetical protein